MHIAAVCLPGLRLFFLFSIGTSLYSAWLKLLASIPALLLRAPPPVVLPPFALPPIGSEEPLTNFPNPVWGGVCAPVLKARLLARLPPLSSDAAALPTTCNNGAMGRNELQLAKHTFIPCRKTCEDEVNDYE